MVQKNYADAKKQQLLLKMCTEIGTTQMVMSALQTDNECVRVGYFNYMQGMGGGIFDAILETPDIKIHLSTQFLIRFTLHIRWG